LQRLSETLLEKETIDLKGIIEILGDRPFPPKENFRAYLETKKEIEKEKEQKLENKLEFC
jgi:AFG3 family protein